MKNGYAKARNCPNDFPKMIKEFTGNIHAGADRFLSFNTDNLSGA
jgi:hypothetical protein